MVVVGFDVGKSSIFGARLDRSGQIKEHWELENTPAALLPLLRSLRRRYKHLVIAAEATNEYHRPVAQLCLTLNIPFRLLNPITTKQFTRATVRKKKTDKTDAEVIARVAAQGQGTLVTEDTFNDIKPMLRTAIRLVQMSRALTLLQYHLVTVLPREDTLLQALASSQEQLEVAAATFRATARAQVNPKLSKLLQSVPGVGTQTAALLVAEIGDINKFKNAKAVIAYIGFDPRVKQSGALLKQNTHLTKRGSPYLRRALYLAAAAAERHDLELKATYDKKRAEGKRYREATIVVARRVITRVYAVWKRGTLYQKKIA
jgi:transposase